MRGSAHARLRMSGAARWLLRRRRSGPPRRARRLRTMPLRPPRAACAPPPSSWQTRRPRRATADRVYEGLVSRVLGRYSAYQFLDVPIIEVPSLCT